MTAESTAARTPQTANIDCWVFHVAGLFILMSVALAQWHSPYWPWFTAFVGANLLQSSFTGFCPLVLILRRLGVRPGAAFHTPAGST